MRQQGFDDLKNLLVQIENTNEQIGAYEDEALCKALQAEWLRLRYQIGFHISSKAVDKTRLFEELSLPQRVFLKVQAICATYPGVKRKIIKIYCILKSQIKRKE